MHACFSEPWWMVRIVDYISSTNQMHLILFLLSFNSFFFTESFNSLLYGKSILFGSFLASSDYGGNHGSMQLIKLMIFFIHLSKKMIFFIDKC